MRSHVLIASLLSAATAFGPGGAQADDAALRALGLGLSILDNMQQQRQGQQQQQQQRLPRQATPQRQPSGATHEAQPQRQVWTRPPPGANARRWRRRRRR